MTDWARVWCDVTWSVTWQASSIALIVVLVSRLWRRLSGPLRYALLLVALAKFALPPDLALPTGLFSSFAERPTRIVREPNLRIDEPIASAGPGAAADVVGLGSPPARIRSAAGSTTARSAPAFDARDAVLSGIALAHVLGATALAVWLLVQLVRLRRIITTARPPDDDALRRRFLAAARRFGFRRPPELLVMQDEAVPFASGILRRRVLVPRVIRAMSPDEQTAVFSHELAHHRRGDITVAALTNAILCAWWFNPFLWILVGEIRRAREDRCDDLVLASRVVSGEVYCGTLLRAACLAGIQASAAVVARMSANFLKARFRRILDDGTKKWRRISLAGSAATAGIAMVLLPGVSPQDGVLFSGTVIGADGRAANDAYVGVQYRRSSEEMITLRPIARTGPDGSFQLVVDVDDVPHGATTMQVFATGAGAGPAWTPVRESGATNLRLALPGDLTLEGTVVRPDGSPAAGARLRVTTILASRDGDLERFREEIDRGNVRSLRPDFGLLSERFAWSPDLPGAVAEVDANGNARIAGIGRDRVALVAVDGPGVGSDVLCFATIDAPSFSCPAAGRRGARPIEYHTAGFRVVLSEGRSVGGIVRDAVSGAPLADALVSEVLEMRPPGAPPQPYRFAREPVRARTDALGRYRLEGLPADAAVYVRAGSLDAGTLYPVIRVARPSAAAAPLDFEVGPKIVVRGRVVDRTTGAPIAGARVEFEPDFENRWLGDARAWFGEPIQTDADGRFALAALPGPGTFAVSAPGPHASFVVCDEAGHHALASIDPAPSSGPIDLELSVATAATIDRPVVDEDGAPVAGCRVTRIRGAASSIVTLNEPSIRVPRDRGGLPSLILIRHVARGLATSLESQPADAASVVLRRTGRLTGRLIDPAGRPRADTRVHLAARVPGAPDAVVIEASDVRTDDAGRFTFEDVVAGLPYRVMDAVPTDAATATRGTDVVVSPGETLDVGDVGG